MTADNNSEKKHAAASTSDVENATAAPASGAEERVPPQAPAPASAQEPASLNAPIETAAPAPRANSAVKPATAAAPKVPPPAGVKPATPAAAKPAAPPPLPFKAEPSLPFSMINVIDGADGVSTELGERVFRGELEGDFESALAQVEIAPRRLPLGRRLKRLLMRPGPGRLRRRADELKRTERHVGFDGFRTSLYDEKTERDRRYGTVYSVSEETNAYIARLEFPRVVPSSSLKRMWNVSDEMPNYDYTISLEEGVLTIRASVRGEAYRRLSYISASFPADFMTRIQLAKKVEGFKHRLRDKVLEIIIFKAAGDGLQRAV